MCYYVNNMKRIIPAILLLLALTGCYNSGEPRERVLKIYNWADYIGEGVLEDFQAYYKEQTGENIRIVYQTFDINEIMLTKIEKGHEDFDVVCPSEYIIERMLKKHLLLPIDTNFAHSPNYMNNVAPFIRKQINKLSQPGEKASRYAVCYMWGTAGILYNRAYVPDSVALSWDCLWNKKYAGKILMKDSYRDAYGTAVIYAHAKELKEGTVTVEELMNDYSPRAMELAEKYLKASHRSYCLCSACKTKNLFRYIFRDCIIVQILNVASVDTECGKAFLCVSGKYGSKVYSSRTFCAVESPDSFRIMRVHIHRFSTIAPARSDGNGRADPFSFKLFRTSGTFGYASDRAIGYNTFYRTAITVFQVAAD